MKEIAPGFLVDGLVRLYMVGFDWVEDNTYRKCKKK